MTAKKEFGCSKGSSMNRGRTLQQRRFKAFGKWSNKDLSTKEISQEAALRLNLISRTLCLQWKRQYIDRNKNMLLMKVVWRSKDLFELIWIREDSKEVFSNSWFSKIWWMQNFIERTWKFTEHSKGFTILPLRIILLRRMTIS